MKGGEPTTEKQEAFVQADGGIAWHAVLDNHFNMVAKVLWTPNYSQYKNQYKPL